MTGATEIHARIAGSKSKRFDALLLASAAIVWWTDAAGEFVEEQPYWRAYTGQTWEEYRGSRWVSCLHPDDCAQIIADWTRAVATGGPYFTEGRIWSAKHNAYRAFQTRGIAIRDENGAIYEWLGALTDVQDTLNIKHLLESAEADLARSMKELRLREAESRAQAEALAASEARLAAKMQATSQLLHISSLFVSDGHLQPVLSEVLDSAISITGADFGNIQLLDPATSGLRIAVQRGFPDWWLAHWNDVTENRGACGAALARGERIIIEDVERSPVFVGTPALDIHLRANVRAVQSTPLMTRAGTLLGMISTHYKTCRRPDETALRHLDLLARQAADIIERADTEQKIKESEERLRLALEGGELGSWDVDLITGKAVWNRRHAAMQGFDPDMAPVTMEMWRSRIHPDDLDRVMATFDEAAKSHTPLNIEHRFRPVGTGETRWMHLYGRFSYADGKPVRLTGVSLDITERKQNEDQVQLLMREVNHRAKNLLGLVQSVAGLTASSSPHDFVVRFRERIAALAASQDLLVKGGWTGIPIDELVRSQLAFLADILDRRIHLHGPPLKILSTAAQTLGMALHELATNAAKYGALSTAEGTVAIEWGVRDDEHQRPAFSLTWKETGGPVVVPPERKGFGTTVITTMVRMSFDCEPRLSFEHTGLTWQINCPASKVIEGVGLISSPPAMRQASRRDRLDKRVLVLDDEPLIAMEMAEALTQAEFDVVGPATSVEHALALLDGDGCEAAVLDINLGRETSERVAERLRREKLPFITVSGYGPAQRPVGFADCLFLPKPLKPEALVEALNQCFSGPAT